MKLVSKWEWIHINYPNFNKHHTDWTIIIIVNTYIKWCYIISYSKILVEIVSPLLFVLSCEYWYNELTSKDCDKCSHCNCSRWRLQAGAVVCGLRQGFRPTVVWDMDGNDTVDTLGLTRETPILSKYGIVVTGSYSSTRTNLLMTLNMLND